MGDFALPALFTALALFWISTRQFATWLRLLIWLGGAALLVLAAWSSLENPDQFGLAQAIADSVNADLREAAIVRALELNGGSIAPFLHQLLDFFLVVGALLGALALIAFTRGERLEKFVRPTLLCLAAFVAGSVAALAVVAIGFGGYMRPRTYSINESNLSSVIAHDGDTFRIGDYSLRLYGIDAPESDQECGRLEQSDCGEEALRWLTDHLSDGVQCDQTLSRTGRPRDGLGRALVRCWIPGENGLIDLSERMVREGYAVQYRGDDYGYSEAQEVARTAGSGLMGRCSLRPDVWRNNDEARAAFERDGTILPDVATMGACAS